MSRNKGQVKKNESAFKADMLKALTIPGISYFRKVRGSGSTIGVPDVFGAVVGRSVCLELKVHPEVVTPRQAEDLRRFCKAGAYCAAVTLGSLSKPRQTTTGRKVQAGEPFVIVVPVIPNPTEGEPFVHMDRIDALEGTPWLQEDAGDWHAYELPIVRRKGGSVISVIGLINRAAGYEVLKAKESTDE